jgi:deferrochelatase/peroxidase EfeB
MSARIQPGIHIESGTTPQPAYRLLLVNTGRGATPPEVSRGLHSLLAMLNHLQKGRVLELAGESATARAAAKRQFESLDVLIGYGRRLFDEKAHSPALTSAERPDFLSYLPDDGPFPTLRWAFARSNAEADFAIQLTASNDAAVTSAAIEVSKLIADHRLPLKVAASFDGFGRSDGRGWLGFHDGVSNMPADQRLQAITASADPNWMTGGTYMAYLRLPVDMTAWRSLSRTEQELSVGRNKLSGGAIVHVRSESGRPTPIAARAPSPHASATEVARWRDPPQTSDPTLEKAHIARANQTRASPLASGAWRIFRQGYDFFESVGEEMRVGLNFVSFQRDLRVLQQILHQPDWLGDANFGGTALATDTPLISVAAGGLYAIPPRGKPFPGAEIFASN